MQSRRLRRATVPVAVVTSLLYLLSPHFLLLHHAHPGGGHAHSHGFQGVAEARAHSHSHPHSHSHSHFHSDSHPHPHEHGSGNHHSHENVDAAPDPDQPPGLGNNLIGAGSGAHDPGGDRSPKTDGPELRRPHHVAHSHYVQDPDILALGVEPLPAVRVFGALPHGVVPETFPGSGIARDVRVRGPPLG